MSQGCGEVCRGFRMTGTGSKYRDGRGQGGPAVLFQSMTADHDRPPKLNGTYLRPRG
jgi:hypothetical protein